MCHNQKKLIGALIGLARATDGNEHLITSSATAVVLAGLRAARPETDVDGQVLEELLSRVSEEKRKMVPNCFLCACPCGRTSDFDISELDKADAEVRVLKNRILSGIQRIAAQSSDNCDSRIFYQALVVIGMEDYTADDLLPILREVEEMAEIKSRP